MLISRVFVSAVIAGAALIPIVWVGWEVRRHSHAVPRLRLTGRGILAVRVSFVILTLVGAVAATAAAVNQHYSYFLSVGSLAGHVSPDLTQRRTILEASSVDRDEAMHGVVQKLAVGGAWSGLSPKPLYVYLPPQYFDRTQAKRRWPVAYMLHGSPGVAVDWIRTGRIDQSMDYLLRHHAVEPFIIVMPDFDLGYARDTQCEDIPDGPQMQTYLTHDVVSYIDTHYRTIPDRRYRAIGGFSAGAYCGINLAMRHQNVFSAFISQSGYTRPDNNRYTRDLFGHSRYLRSQNTPQYYLPDIPIELPLGAYIDAGRNDHGSRVDSTFVADTLRRRGAFVTFDLFNGDDHTWLAAREHGPLVLRWISDWFACQSSPRVTLRTPVKPRSWRRPTAA